MIKKKKYKYEDDYEVGEYKPVSHTEVKKRWMKNPAFRKACDDIQPEYAILRQIIK